MHFLTKDNIFFDLGILLDLPTVMDKKFLDEYALNPDDQILAEDICMDCLKNILEVQTVTLCQWLHASSHCVIQKPQEAATLSGPLEWERQSHAD